MSLINVVMTDTITVAKDRAFDESKTVLPAEVARGVYIENPPNAEALKLMHLLIGKAGGAMADDKRHDLKLADIKKIAGMRNHSRATLRQLFTELAGAVMVFDDTEAQREIIGGFLDQATLDYKDQINGDILISWWFGRAFRRIAEQSNHWAIIDRQTVFALSSKYSILLFQHIASLANLSHVQKKTFTVAELRSLLGVQEGKLKTWNDCKKRALQPAIAEINQTSRLTLEATYHKTGRTVSSVTISWRIKADIKAIKTAQADHSMARVGKLKAAQERLSFPAIGSVKYSDPWQQIARDNCNWDHSKIADAFRSFCAQKNINLDAKKIEEIFTNFCAKQPTI
jgi:hypothetical protein